LFSGHLLSICLYCHPYCKASNMLDFELCYSQRGYYFLIQSLSYNRHVRLADKPWLKVLFADLL
jgi:hypothetical protein